MEHTREGIGRKGSKNNEKNERKRENRLKKNSCAKENGEEAIDRASGTKRLGC